MDELQDYVKLVDQATGIEVSGLLIWSIEEPCSPLPRSPALTGPGTLIDSFRILCGTS